MAVSIERISSLFQRGKITRADYLLMLRAEVRRIRTEIAQFSMPPRRFTAFNMREWANSAASCRLSLLPAVKLPAGLSRNRAARPARRSSASATASGNGDPDPDPERPYIALGIDHKATTPAGPPAPVSLRPVPLYRIEMRRCRYEYPRQHHAGPQGPDSTPP